MSVDGLDGLKVKRLAELLTELDRTFRDDFKRSSGVPCNLTVAQYQVISMIVADGDASQKRISENLGVTGPTVVRIIDALEKKELVYRTRDKEDRRIVLISLTDKGRRAQFDCAEMHEGKLATMVARLPTNTTDTLLDNLSALLKAAKPAPAAAAAS
jgi:DNA-binding MarR family transcriptional regulator